MKQIFFFVLGIILGIFTIDCVWSFVSNLIGLHLISAAIAALFAWIFFHLAVKCFKKV